MGKTRFGNANAMRNNNAKDKNQFDQEFHQTGEVMAHLMEDAEAIQEQYGMETAPYAAVVENKMRSERPNMKKQKNHQ